MDRKYKKTAWLTAGMMLMASLPAFAAGLGKLTVTSTLGQPLRGEIDLLAVDKKDLGSIRARFASFDAFKEAKIERSPVLSAIHFSVEQKKNGDPYLKITSTKPVDEPFLDMLIELDWPAGRLVREYTVLLDPPGYGEQQAEVAPAVSPTAKSAPASPVPSGDASMRSADAPMGSVKPAIRARIPLDRKLLSEEAKEMAGSDQEAYGPVRKGENLSGIASALKPEGVSLEQMLVALFQSNKQAFAGSNMNRLKAGQILRLPDAGQVETLSTKEASRQVRVHSADWHAYRQKLAAAVAETRPGQEGAARQASSGKITTAVEDKAAVAKESATDVLKLSKSESMGGAKPAAAAVGAAGGGKDAQAMKGQILALQEEATAKEKAIKEANQRISDLEKNINEMRKLLELKNQNLADLQQQAAAAKTAPAVLPPPVAPAVAKPEEKPAAPAAIAEKAPEAAAKPAVKAKAAPKPIPVEQEKPEPSFLDAAMENPLYLGGGAAAILLLGLLGAKAVVARRRKNVSSFEDSIMTHGDLKANTVMGDTSGGKVDTSDTSFLTDFSQAGLGSIDTNEVDPIAEAEVYMAYGRDAQAEEILKEALSKDPERHEIRLKLLEIYGGRKDLNAFEAEAGEMYAALGGQASPVWDKAAEMGRALDPRNPLYSDKSKAAVEPGAGAGEGMFDKTMIVAGGAAGLVAAAEHGAVLDLGGPEITQAAETDLDFNLDIAAPTVMATPEVLLPEQVKENPPVEEAALDLGFDLDLGALTGAAVPAAQPAVAPSVAAEEPVADMGLDFNLDMAAPTVAVAAPAPAEIAMEPDEGVMEFDLGAPTQAAPAAPAEELISAESWKDEVMSLDVGELPAAPGTEDEMAEIGNNLEMPDFSMEEETAAVGEEMESIELAALPVEESPLDFDFNLDQEETPAPTEAKGTTVPDLDLSGISLDMSEPVAVKNAPADLPDEFGSQEVSTKLDLARAYIDMGDVEGARDILQEVLKEGASDQQDDARKLLAELG